ncbi:hypothetical protein BUZ67_09480 [Staphylococcus pasteuri]|uniref:DUF5668 domain-containing protein n=1 Tax=Staphylococcus pasteuri TaxID=45972 RepID=UPI000D358F0A|nr:DUF5668 domain-containing protein [Staphylococcus pasteuri]PTU84004.1 hypothetical protein BUZ67_09480 [Staphylococcus pasteuri]
MFNTTDTLMNIGNLFHVGGNIALGIAFGILIIFGVYALLYDKTSMFSHNWWTFKERAKKFFKVIFILIGIAIVLHIIGAFITPNINTLN